MHGVQSNNTTESDLEPPGKRPLISARTQIYIALDISNTIKTKMTVTMIMRSKMIIQTISCLCMSYEDDLVIVLHFA